MKLADAFGRCFAVSLIGGRECQSGDGEFNLHLPGAFLGWFGVAWLSCEGTFGR
jgi:hypothetical protein